MKLSCRFSIILAGCVLFFLLCSACALTQYSLRTQLAEKTGIKGTCTVILYGANHYNDIATVALIIPEGSRYFFDIFAPEFNYRTIKGVQAEDAVRMSENFVSWHSDFSRSQTSSISDAGGTTIGYEVRPLYRQTTFGMQDVMYVDYFLEGNNTVSVHVHLNYDVERKLMGGSDDRDGGQ
jgi:hypothetical protein